MGYITSASDLTRLAARVISDGLPIALDCETGYEGEDRAYKNSSPSLHPEESLLAGFNFTNSVSWARYVPVGHDESRYNIDPVAAARALWDITASGLCVVHNADMEERVLSRFLLQHLADDPERGEAVRASRGYFPLRSDTMMECHALAQWQSIALKSLSREVFGYDQVELRDLFSRVTGKPLPANKRYTLRFNVLDPSDPRVFGYACDDVIQTLRLHQRHYDLAKDNFIYRLEMGVWPVVWGMEDEGLAVDWDFVDEARVRASMFRDRMQARLTGYLGERLGKPVKFNPNSAPQLRKILYDPAPDGLGLKTHIMTQGKKDGSGKQKSTAAIALKGNAFDPFVRRLQDYRGMTKLLGTYLEPWKREYGWCEDGRAHCHLLPHGTFTGRTSSADFNYQNLPKKYYYELDDGSVFELNFRDCVTVPPGYWGLGFDISQGELRVIAAEAGEQAMLEAFERDEDLHVLTAMRLLHMTKEEVLAGGELHGVRYPAEKGGFRPFGKTMNFALGYQLTVQGLADRLGCSIEEAQEAFDGYFAAYPAIAAWTRRTVAESKVQGYTQSRFGRRHPIWDYGKNHCWQHRVAEHGCWQCEKTARRNLESGERTAGNAPIQGGLADMMKLIMIRCDAALAKAGLKDRVRLVMNVHDALEFYVHDSVSQQEVIDLLYPAITAKTPMTQHWPVMRPDWHTWTRWGHPAEVRLDEDHQVVGLGDILDIGLQEEDEEDDDAEGEAEAIPAAAWPPDVATGPPAAVVRPPDRMGGGSDPGVGDSKAGHTGRVLVKVREMPELARVDRLMLMLGEFPGPNQLDLVVPEGQVTLSRGTSLSPADSARISLLLGSAEVVWDTQSVDNAALAQGLALLPEKVGLCRYGRA